MISCSSPMLSREFDEDCADLLRAADCGSVTAQDALRVVVADLTALVHVYRRALDTLAPSDPERAAWIDVQLDDWAEALRDLRPPAPRVRVN